MDRIESLIKELTLEEAVSIVSGSDGWHSTGVERLSIPRLKMTDGPNGARGDGISGKSSACFPCGIALGSIWDLEIIYSIGKAIGKEAKSKDADVLLGPTINIHRHPLGGRHFECYSEDPLLTGKIASSFVKGVQSERVAACLKHFAGNDTEFKRHEISSNIKARVLREIYLLPFEMGVKLGGALVVMSAYNKLNNIFCSSHEELLNNILKEEWSFPGYVVSDWGASLQTVENANGGLDLEMPGPAKTWGTKLLDAIHKGKVQEQKVFEKVRRILKIAEFSGRLDSPNEKPEQSNDLENDRKLIRQAAGESIVLLKNNNLLPLDKKQIKKIALIGPNIEKGQFIGGGSATVKAHYVIHPKDALKEYLGDGVELKCSEGCHIYKYLPSIDKRKLKDPVNGTQGFQVEFFEGDDLGGKVLKSETLTGGKFWALSGFGVGVASKFEPPSLSVRFSSYFRPDISGEYLFELISIGSSRLKIDGKEIIDNWNFQEEGDAFFGFGSAAKRSTCFLEKNQEYFIEIEYEWSGRFPAVQIGMLPPDKEDLLEQAISLAKESDAVLLIVGTNSDWETEGNDRSDIFLPGKQDELIEKICKVNSNTIVAINTGSPISMSWVDKVKSILQIWFTGQEYGRALTDIVFGDVNPSGKLPTTFPMKLEDTPAFSSYPGKNLQMDYDEGLYVGYRWYEKEGIKPLFPFGHGLSYTTFEYSDLRIIPPKTQNSAISFEVTISNTGGFKGKEVVQCYVKVENSRINRPSKELKVFEKVELDIGESKKLIFNLSERDLAYWDESAKNWSVEPAEYRILVGSSSEDIRLENSAWLG